MALAVVSVVWTRINPPVEGPSLIRLKPGRALTVGDLPSVVGIVLAVRLWRRSGTVTRRSGGRTAHSPGRQG